MTTRCNNVFHFPDGSTNSWVDLSYSGALLTAGELVTFETLEETFIIAGVQNQFRTTPCDEVGYTQLKMIIRHVTLEHYEGENKTW
jgi:hypothetical protein